MHAAKYTAFQEGGSLPDRPIGPPVSSMNVARRQREANNESSKVCGNLLTVTYLT